MATITGTFEGTGNSATVRGSAIIVDLTFAGTATVNVQWAVDGTNFRTKDSYTASKQYTATANGIMLNGG